VKIKTIGSENFSARRPRRRELLFRLKVLERREKRRFQRQSFTILVGALVIILVSTFGISSGERRWQRPACWSSAQALPVPTSPFGAACYGFLGASVFSAKPAKKGFPPCIHPPSRRRLTIQC
jgi:hypothetical protein